MTRRAILATCLAGALVGFGHAALTTDVPPACHSVDVSEESGVTADYLALLRDDGYVGDPRDGADRLYAPDCPNAVTAQLLIEHHNQ